MHRSTQNIYFDAWTSNSRLYDCTSVGYLIMMYYYYYYFFKVHYYRFNTLCSIEKPKKKQKNWKKIKMYAKQRICITDTFHSVSFVRCKYRLNIFFQLHNTYHNSHKRMQATETQRQEKNILNELNTMNIENKLCLSF